MIPAHEAPTFQAYDPEFLLSRVQDATNCPGPRDRLPTLTGGGATAHERVLAREDPFGARDWDVLADRRRDAWLRCPFAIAYDLLFVKR